MNSAQSTPVFSPTDNETLADQISELAAHIHAATYRFLLMIREFDQRQAWVETGARSCAQWLHWRCGFNLHTAREKVRIAHALVDLEKISGAFERGALSYSKVRVLTRIANPDNEEMLLNIAVSGTAAQLERVVRCDLRMEREEDIQKRTKATFEQREFGWTKQDDGSVVFFGRLPAELAQQVINAIEANLKAATAPETDPEKNPESVSGIEPEIRSEIESESEPETASNPESELKTKFQSESEPETAPEPESESETETESETEKESKTAYEPESESETKMEPDPKNGPAGTPGISDLASEHSSKPSLATRRADALVALCNAGCEGYEVTLHVPAGPSLHSNSLKNAGTIPMEAAKRICCDAAIVPITVDEHGHVLDIGRRTRKIPPAIRRALEIRDKGCCRFPGCTSRRFLKAHHIEHWAQGGKTCVDNLVLLCWHHHRSVHEGGFGCRAIRRRGEHTVTAGVTIVFSTPGGIALPDVFSVKPVQGKLETQQQALRIDAQTCTARDFGTPLDTNVVIDALAFFRRRRKD